MRLLRGPIAGTFVAAAMLAAQGGAAAGLHLEPAGLVAAQLPVSPCDTTATLSWTTEHDAGLDAETIHLVSLSNLDQACDGRRFQVTLADDAGQPLTSGAYLDPPGPTGQLDPKRQCASV